MRVLKCSRQKGLGWRVRLDWVVRASNGRLEDHVTWHRVMGQKFKLLTCFWAGIESATQVGTGGNECL